MHNKKNTKRISIINLGTLFKDDGYLLGPNKIEALIEKFPASNHPSTVNIHHSSLLIAFAATKEKPKKFSAPSDDTVLRNTSNDSLTHSSHMFTIHTSFQVAMVNNEEKEIIMANHCIKYPSKTSFSFYFPTS